MAKPDVRIELIGAKELKRVFRELPKEMNDKILRDINRAGALEYKKAMKEAAPVGSDKIHNNIVINTSRKDKTAVMVGVGRKTYWARFIEYGTKVRKSRGKITPKAFIQPAIERTTNKATRRIFDDTGKRVLSFLKRNVKRINKKNLR